MDTFCDMLEMVPTFLEVLTAVNLEVSQLAGALNLFIFLILSKLSAALAEQRGLLQNIVLPVCKPCDSQRIYLRLGYHFHFCLSINQSHLALEERIREKGCFGIFLWAYRVLISRTSVVIGEI